MSTVRRVKIGFLGGSFDPVHFGHLMAAQDVYEQHHLDRLILVPAAQAPLKPNDVQSSADDRMAMLRAATEWDHRFEISDVELRRGGVSYTIDSVRHFRALYPADELYWIIGGVAKEGGIASLAPYFDRLAHVYLIGKAAPLFKTQLPATVKVTDSGTLDQAFADAVADALADAQGAAASSPWRSDQVHSRFQKKLFSVASAMASTSEAYRRCVASMPCSSHS